MGMLKARVWQLAEEPSEFLVHGRVGDLVEIDDTMLAKLPAMTSVNPLNTDEWWVGPLFEEGEEAAEKFRHDLATLYRLKQIRDSNAQLADLSARLKAVTAKEEPSAPKPKLKLTARESSVVIVLMLLGFLIFNALFDVLLKLVR